jgi:hypothetical protein
MNCYFCHQPVKQSLAGDWDCYQHQNILVSQTILNKLIIISGIHEHYSIALLLPPLNQLRIVDDLAKSILILDHIPEDLTPENASTYIDKLLNLKVFA